MKPETLLFAKTHEWVAVADEGGQKIATVGITRLRRRSAHRPRVHRAAESRPPGEGRRIVLRSRIRQGGERRLRPVAGEVIAANDKLADDLETLSQDPFGEGWIASIKIADDAGLKNLMDYAAYQKQCAEEAH